MFMYENSERFAEQPACDSEKNVINFSLFVVGDVFIIP